MNNEQLDRGRTGDLPGQLRAVDFALTETVLYLDAYPDDRQALTYYQSLISERRRLAEQYEKSVGPLTAIGNRDAATWNWTATPWPWERAANC